MITINSNKERELLIKLYDAFTKLDISYCTMINRNSFEHSLSYDDYEKAMDIAIEVENYLKT